MIEKISIAQNQEGQLLRLAAQRQLYATAKKIFVAQLIISVPVAIASAILVAGIPESKEYVAIWGFIAVMADILLLNPWLKRVREQAAKIQEVFDCEVLGLPWNGIKAGKKPDPELVHEQAEKYKKWQMKMPPLVDWYSPKVDELPVQLGRIACQRSNCWWDAKQRRLYAKWIIGSIIAMIITVFLLALVNDLTLADFMMKVVAPLSPCLVVGIRQFFEQTDSANRLDGLKEHCEKIWEKSFPPCSAEAAMLNARNLQDEIFENRRKSPFVFDALFKRLRDKYEKQMQHGVTDYVHYAVTRLQQNKGA